MYIVLKLPGYHPGWLERITRCTTAVHSRSRPAPSGAHPFTQKDDESSAECKHNTEL